MSTAAAGADSGGTPEAVRRLRLRKRALQRADPRRLLPRVGSTVGGFLLEERLGAGGFGTVFRARRGPHLYALKFLYLPRIGRWGRRELEVLLRVPLAGGLLSVEGHGYWPDDVPLFLYLVMPYVHGSRLFVWARRTRPSARQVAHLVLALTRQLRAVHHAGVVHRDVKGDNVLVHARTGQPVLVDFGVGTYPGAPEVTGPRPPGTARYRSPESLRFRHQCKPGERYPASPRDDLWALGVLLYVLLTGAYPFDVEAEDEEAEEAALEALILEARPVAPHERNPRVPRALSELCLRLLEKAPEARYASAGVVGEALEAVLEGATEEAAWDVPLVEWASSPEVLEAAREEEEPPLETELSEALSSAGELPLQSLTEKEEAPAPDAPEPSPPTAPRAPTPVAASVARRGRGVGWAGVALGLGALLGALLLAPERARLEPRVPTAGSDFSGQEVAPAWKPPEGGPGAVPPWAPTPAPVASATPSEDMRMKSPQQKPPQRKALSRPQKAAVVATCTVLAGCPAAQVLPANPPSEACPPGAVEAMEKLGLFSYEQEIQDGVLLGAKSGTVRLVVRPGSAATLQVSKTGSPLASLSGRFLLGEGRVYARFTQATLDSGKSVPVCFELYSLNERKAGYVSEGGSGPDTGRIHAGLATRAVRRFE
jgi:serine/threonine-protein kinase